MKGFENNADFCKMCFDNDSKKMKKKHIDPRTVRNVTRQQNFKCDI